ncbi:MAG TPA: hypothetical protein VKZ53_10155 [Candidatus Angelobacter sp.]|nr:hypothetical protein [Candidatus Angelobacter sp.]
MRDVFAGLKSDSCRRSQPKLTDNLVYILEVVANRAIGLHGPIR